MAKELKRTKNSIVMYGVVGNLENDDKGNGFTEGVNERGRKFKQVRLSLKTSKSNVIYAECKGYMNDFVYFYNNNTKTTKKVPWAERFSFNEPGFKLMTPDYDMIDEMSRVLKNGMSIKLKMSYVKNNWVSDGMPKTREFLKITEYEVIDDLNLDSPDYKEVNFVNMEVITKKTYDTPDGKLALEGYVIDSFHKPMEITLIATNPEEMYGLRSLRYGSKIEIQNGKYVNSREREDIVIANKAGFGPATIVQHKDVRKSGFYFDTVNGTTVIEGMYAPEDIAAAMEGAVVNNTPKPTATTTPEIIEDDDTDLDL